MTPDVEPKAVVARPASVPRVVLAARPDRRDHLQGAWWPFGLDVQHELSQMLPVALSRFATVLGVSLSRDEWPGAPLICQPLVNRSPKVNWYGLGEPHLAVLHCGGQRQIALLVVPPSTPDAVATVAMLMAAAPGNCLTTTETLKRATQNVDAMTRT